MALIRMILRFIVLFADKINPVKKIDITEEEQIKIDKLMKGMVLYHYPACPFCIKVARKMRTMSMDIEKRDPRIEPFKSELMQGGGEQQVPCLKIGRDEKALWMYESSEIILYLENEFERILEKDVFSD
jgi:glutaredoxin